MEMTKEKIIKTSTKSSGVVTQIVGVVIDAEFSGALPAIYNALVVSLDGKDLMFEVAQHLSQYSVRAVALGSTDGLARGTKITDTGAAISVPVGNETVGRMLNVVGEPIDGKPALKVTTTAPIHKEPPSLSEQSGKVEIFETGIKNPRCMRTNSEAGNLSSMFFKVEWMMYCFSAVFIFT